MVSLLLVNSPVELKSYWDLHQWSINNLSIFWSEIWSQGGIKGETSEVVESNETSITSFQSNETSITSIPSNETVEVIIAPNENVNMDHFPKWFPQRKLNFTQNLLFPAVEKADSEPCLHFRSEIDSLSCDWTWGQLRAQVAALQRLLRDDFRIKAGDRIAAYAPNCPQVLAYMLAGASIGAIFTAASPDFGPAAVVDRFSQTQPRVLLTCNGVYYNGRVHDHLEKTNQVLQSCLFIESVIQLDYISNGAREIDWKGNIINWRDIPLSTTASSSNLDLSQKFPFSHPLYILYSSGTTGKPKCIVHSAGGSLLQHCKEHWLHGRIDDKSCLLQYTTIGWMMWQWQVGALQRGCRLFLYDGSPFRPQTDRLWQLMRKLGVTHFGTSAKYLQLLQESRFKPEPSNQLQVIFSTGSPLPADTFKYLYHILPEVQVASITGGTDIISLFAGGCPLLPVWPGEVQAPCLGMAIEAWNEQGLKSVEGDLVCVKPFPCQPVAFWGDDEEQSKYRSAYFGHFPHIWHHGDFIRISPATGGIWMLGRSDGTLNPAGVRFGSADLYAICAGEGEIEDALAVGVKRPGWADEQVFLFCKLRAGEIDFESLKGRLTSRIRSQLSPRHVPARIMACPGIPYTLNGKKVEVAVKRVLSGAVDLEVANLGDPEVMEFYRQLSRDMVSKL